MRMRKLFHIIFIISILFRPVIIRAIISDREFYESLNLDYPGLESVKTAVASGDTGLAGIKLLEYYQNRTSVKYFELSGSSNVSDADDNLNHYFTVTGDRKYAGESDGTIDWSTHDSKANEWHWQFHRMYWIVNLGKVYGSTNNEKYAVEWISELVDWIEDNSPGYPRTLDTGIRIENWVESYQYFIKEYGSPSISPEDHVSILKSLMEQCRFLRDNWRSEGNWGASETRGLCAVVVMFPEFKFTSDGNWEWWRDLVISRLHHHLSNDFYPDGVQFETSPSYHSIEYRNLFLSYKLLNLNAINVSDALVNLFVKPLEFMMHIHKPDGYVPQLSDTDRLDYLDQLKEGAELVGRLDMLYAATKGSRGIPPQETFAPFPYGGYFVMRSDWGENRPDYGDTKYLVFDTGSNEPWHAHYDILNFEAYANKYVMIRDAGRYTYTEGYWRDYFKNTSAHNTVVIDGKSQEKNTSGSAVYFTSLPGFDFVSGRHEAYKNLTHERSIFFVKPEYWIIADLITGKDSHNFDLYFHLDSPYLNHTVLDKSDNSVSTPNFIIIPSDISASADIIDGWISNSYHSKTEAPIIKYRKSGSPPVTFETVLLPYDTGVIPITVEKQQVFWNKNAVDPSDGVCIKVQLEKRQDWFFLSNLSPGILTIATFQCDADVVFIRTESDNTISSIRLVQGSLLYKGDTLLVDTDAEFVDLSWFERAVFIESEFVKNAKVWAPDADSVIVNGNKINFRREGNYISIDNASGRKDETLSTRQPEHLYLAQNYPNPFNSETSILFYLKRSHTVVLGIFNTRGQCVRILINEYKDKGLHTVIWDGRDETGNSVHSGVYLYRIITKEGSSICRKTVIIR